MDRTADFAIRTGHCTDTRQVSCEHRMHLDRILNTISAMRIPTIIAFFFIADIAMLLFYLVNQAVGAPFEFPTHLVDLNGEANLPTWYSVIQLACVAALAGLFAVRNVRPVRIGSWSLLLLPLFFLALSVDELAQIHEWVGFKSDALLPGHDRLNTIFPYTGIWMLLFGIPFVAGFFGIIFMLRRYLNTVPGVLPKFLLGFAIFAIGATLIEILSNYVIYGSFWYYMEATCEEGCEMLGVTIILWAFHDLLRGHGFSIHLDPVDEQWS